MAHSHAHPHSGQSALSALGRGFALTLLILAVEAAVAFLSHSLALLADAGHVLTDLFALGLSWFAVKQAARPADEQFTFGHHRTGIIVALINATTLILIAGYIVSEAYERFLRPVAVHGWMMMGAALVGLVVNLFLGSTLAGQQGENLNLKSVFIHVMGDAVASLGVIVAAVLMAWRHGWYWLDPALSVAIAVLIAAGAWQIVKDASRVLMETVPKEIDLPSLVERLRGVPGVDGVHDLHVWSIASGMPLLTCHILLRETEVFQSAAVMNEVRHVLQHDFGIEHSTVQPEWELCGPDNLFCTLDSPPLSRGDETAAGHPHPHPHL